MLELRMEEWGLALKIVDQHQVRPYLLKIDKEGIYAEPAYCGKAVAVHENDKIVVFYE